MRRLLSYLFVVGLVCACGLDEPVTDGPARGAMIAFSASKMRVITKAGDSAESFSQGTKYNLFAAPSSSSGNRWAASVLYNTSGTETSGMIDYGTKVAYGVGETGTLDFYGVTYGGPDAVAVSGSIGDVPSVALSVDPSYLPSGTADQFPDLMYSDNLKSKTSASGLLSMEFRHALSKLTFELVKQDESADPESQRQLEDAAVKRISIKGTGTKGVYSVESGTWAVSESAERVVYEDASGLPLSAVPAILKEGEKDVAMLVMPAIGDVSLSITLNGIKDQNGDPLGEKTVEYKLMSTASDALRLEQNHEYRLTVTVLKNDVRIVTVTPQKYDWIDVDMTGSIATGENIAYLGQPVYFGGLMWMDRNLGATSADCENDWYNTIGYYYQHGRNIPFIFDVDVWKEKFNTSSKVSFSNDEFTHGLIYSLDENNVRISQYIHATGASAPSADLPYYDDVAKNPGEPGADYRFICGFNSWSSWARGANDRQDARNDVYWNDVENQPCPKGWRLPTRKDMYKYLPEEFYSEAVWQHSYVKGNMLRYDYYSGNRNSLGEEYKWKYFTAKFKADPSQSGEWSYPIPDEYSRVYLIKYEGTTKAYRIMIEQRKANIVDDGSIVKKYVRISRFDATSEDEFLISPDGKQWNLHEFDWETPAEYMDFPLCGYIDSGDGSNSIVNYHPYLGAFGNGCILRSQEIDTSGSLGRNWTMYFMDTYRGVTVGGGSRRSLGDQVRCVRDVNAN